jgi:N4-gp56 family major capsid protein
MGYFIRDVGDGRTPVQHEKDLFKQYIMNTVFSNYMGKKGSGKSIIMDGKAFSGMGNGDTRKYHFVPQYMGTGIRGQNKSIEGNEKSISEFVTEIRVDQVIQAFRKKGKLTDLRTVINLRNEFKDQLTNWFKIWTEFDIIDALTGYMYDGASYIDGFSRDEETGMVMIDAKGAAMTNPLVKGEGRCFRPDYANNKFSVVNVSEANSSNDALLKDMTAGDIMNTQLLDELQALAKTAGKYPIKPVRLQDGREYYILILHPTAAKQLRADERWEKRVLANYQGCRSLENDPIATGAMGVWEKIIVKEADYIPSIGNGTVNIARNLLLGADAAVMAWAQTINYVEKEFDYNTEMGVMADEIRGIKKLDFNGVDLNIAQVPCAI